MSISGRRDELGDAEIRLAGMEEALSRALHQKQRLADLGLAVSKINHDLRNLLASAQLFLERLEHVPDPTVKRLAPKILATLDRAVGYTQAVMSYGKAQERAPQRRLLALKRVGETWRTCWVSWIMPRCVSTTRFRWKSRSTPIRNRSSV